MERLSASALQDEVLTVIDLVSHLARNDLRLRIYEHLHRLSLRYYDHAKVGALVSTITTDVSTIQDFASSSTLSIVVDLLTILFMVMLMFWLEWDFTLIAVALAPMLLLFIFHFKHVMKDATREVRVRQSELLSIVQRGLASVRVTKAFGRQDLELAHLETASHATVTAALRARRIKSLMSPVVNIVVAICTAIHAAEIRRALTLTVPLGPLRAHYEVRAHVASDNGTAADKPHRTLNFKARAGGVGSLRGQIDVALRADDEASDKEPSTRIDYSVWATSTALANFSGLPLSSDSSSASSSVFSAIRSPMRCRMRPRSDGVSRAHGPSSAARAALTARSMSAALPWATWASTSPVPGSKDSKVSPSRASTHLPSISSWRGLAVN